MSALSETSVFQALFQAACKEYEDRTGTNLIEHPLAIQLQTCHSFESLIALLQEQARAFHEFRGGDDKGVTSDGGSCDVLVNLFESITIFLHRLDIYIKIPPTAAMTEIVVKIIVELLSTLAVAAKQMRQGQPQTERFVQNVPGGNEVDSVLQRFDRLTQDEARTTAAQTFQVVYTLLQNVRVVMDECKASTDSVREALMIMQQLAIGTNNSKRDQFQQDVKNWLSPSDPWENHGIALKSHHRNGTAAWFIQGDTYAEWKSSGPLLWVHGKPGSGKTVLCSAIIEDIDRMRKAGLASLAFFYFDLMDDKKKDLRNLLSSLIYQLYDQSDSYLNVFSNFYSAHRRGSQYPSDAALIQCLKDMLNCPGQTPIYILVDGVDECPRTSGRLSPREDVLMLIEELVGLYLPNLHVCISSRPGMDIKAIIHPLAFHSISLHDEKGQMQEIIDYVRSFVGSNPGMRNWTVEDKELVIDELSQKADGMFGWVACQLDVLPDCLPRRIRPTLDKIPATLCGMYERALEEIPDGKWEAAHLLLQCVMVSSRPLLVEELAEFLALDFGTGSMPKLQEGWRPKDPEDAILSTCPGLLTVVDVNGSRIVQFSHSSVKEFLISSGLAGAGGRSSRYYIDIARARTVVAQACLGVLLSFDGEISRYNARSFPLANYAARHWVDHVPSENVPSSIQSTVQLLLNSGNPHFAVWISIYNLNEHLPPDPRAKSPSQTNGTPLHYATMYGFHDVAGFLAGVSQQNTYNYNNYNYGHNYDTRYNTLRNQPPLFVASALGHIDVVRLLLSHRANVNSPSQNGRTPLLWASQEGHLEVAQLLLQYQASTNATDESNRSPLHLASREGHLEVVRLLLEKGADANAQDTSQRTPLHSASQEGHVEIAQLLLDRGSDVKALDDSGRTPLRLALQEGRLQVAQLLLDRGADANARDGSGQTLLHWALQEERPEVAQLLLDRGADANVQDGNDRTPLHWALQEGRLEIVQLLLERGADADPRDALGRTPLHWALQEGRLEVAQLLLERGADANAKDGSKRTPLHWALQEGRLEVSQLLLERGVDSNAWDGSQRTPLHWALQEGRLEAAQLLLERGIDANAWDGSQRAPLHWALQEGRLEVAQLLLERGADANARDGSGRTPFGWALQEGRLDVVQLLLERGENVDTRDRSNRTLLHWALQEGRLDVAQLLLERGENVDARDGSDRTPLHCASQEGCLEAAELLLERGAYANTQDDSDQTPLHLASQEGHVQVAQVLLKRGAFMNARDGNKRTPLHRASQQGHLEVTELLLENGAYPNARDENKRTPLHWASQGGRLDSTQLLLERGAYTNTPDASGQTPLHLASREGRLEVAQLLLERGAYADTWDGSDRTPLHLASQAGCLEVVQLLLDRGADADIRDVAGQTPLHLASQGGRLEVAQLLLERGADANVRTDSGQTPLHVASREGQLDFVQSLLAQGIGNIHARNYEGRTPSQEASAASHHNITQLLLQHGG